MGLTISRVLFSVEPGQTAFTVTPTSRSSRAKAFVRHNYDAAEVSRRWADHYAALAGRGASPVPAGPAAWNLDVELRVYRDVSNRSEFLDTLWQHLREAPSRLG